MSRGKICFSGVHVLQDGMYYGNISLKGGHACRRTCISGEYVPQECMSSEWRIFPDDVSYWNAYFIGQVLLEGMSYRSCPNRCTCLIGVHVLQDNISYRIICPTGRQVLQEDRSNWCVCIIGGRA